MYMRMGGPAAGWESCCVGAQRGNGFVIVEEDSAIIFAYTQPRVRRSVRLGIALAPYPLHIDPMGEEARFHYR
jgi:hypothetical protein